VDSSWSNLEKLVSYSLRAREKPRRDAKRSVSHAFIRSSFDALARSLARSPRVAGDGKSPVRHPSRALALASRE